ncbi:putative Transcriptional regulator, CAP family [uncultured Paludibacter sp.]|nr:putative Transcriptional regulator, CAP family [uncultured Paludibacter sp.]
MSDFSTSNNGCERIAACFHDLNRQELEFINSRKTEVKYLAGETLYKQGAFAPHVLLVLEGLVKVYLQTGNDKQINLFLAKPGDFLAFSSVFGENVYNYSAAAVTDVQICMMDKESMRQVLLGNSNFAMRITSRNCRNESQYLSIIHNLTYRQMRGKLASALLYLSSEDFADVHVFPFLTRQDIANFASIATESAIKFLKEFEKEEIIALEGKDIRILNRKKIEEIEKWG